MKCAVFILGCFILTLIVSHVFCVSTIRFDDNTTVIELKSPIITHYQESNNENILKFKSSVETHNNDTHNAKHEEHRIHLANWRWTEYGKILTPTILMILVVILKLLFHHTPRLSEYVPESCMLIALGLLMGTIIFAEKGYGFDQSHVVHIREYFPRFTSEVFFLLLLPPIILDSAYSISNRQFLDNLGSILVFAVIGTLFNAFLIGYGLYLLNYAGMMGQLPEQLDSIDCLKFSALISAVDPVAVLTIFEDIGVNIGLYFLVFGESLLNDGVSVVLYNSMGALGDIEEASADGTIDRINYALAFFSFFTVVLGGFLIGVFIGIITSYVVKFTEQVRVIEPFMILAMSYLAYILAETVHWSGIISLIGCGVIQKRYAFVNISNESLTTVKECVKTLAKTADLIIFLFLGIVTISNDNLQWHTGFTIWTCILCSVIRFIGVFTLSAMLNRRRHKQISIKEQVIIGYGGLRGAVGFSLAIILSQQDEREITKIFLTSTLFMVYFTVFVQGCTIKILVEKLQIDKEKEKVKLISHDVNMKTIDLVMSGIGSIVGELTYSAVVEHLKDFDKKFIRKWLIRDNVLDSMAEKMKRISLEEHYARLYGPSILAHQKNLRCILESLAPGDDKGSKDISSIGNIHQSILMIGNTTISKPIEKETQNNKGFILSNTEMDKSILQKAFEDTQYERTKRGEYSSNFNSTKKRNSISYQPRDSVRNRRHRDSIIWQNAFPQIFDNFRHFHLLDNDNLNASEGNQMGSIDFIKQAYGEAKGGIKTSRSRQFSDSIVEQSNPKDHKQQNKNEDSNGIITDESQSSTLTTITKL